MPASLRRFMFWMVAALVVYLFWSVSARLQTDERQLSFSDFISQVERGHVARVTIRSSAAGSQILGEFKNGQAIRTFAPPQMENLVNLLIESGVEVNARDANSSSWQGHVISWIPIIIMVAFLIFFMRQVQTARSSPLTPEARREARLELKARILHVLTQEGAGLSDEALRERVSTSGTTPAEALEHQKALYEMLAEGTLVLTEERTFRARTESRDDA